ncbi:hypothetical protein GCM10009547_17010 [Sporichthya brevicatena]|uniref:Uncharacterized protein n=1 Tax=Sporichthya brevicatena TaxID=171442 RepID=A0ABP3RW71_9ACTN
MGEARERDFWRSVSIRPWYAVERFADFGTAAGLPICFRWHSVEQGTDTRIDTIRPLITVLALPSRHPGEQ